jgi:hypothetical protein
MIYWEKSIVLLTRNYRECLAATPHFAKFALPLILEKLSSTSGSAKVNLKKKVIGRIKTLIFFLGGIDRKIQWKH